MKELTEKQMVSEESGLNANHVYCNLLMGVASGIWVTAAGMTSLGAGFALGIGAGLFNDWVCSHF